MHTDPPLHVEGIYEDGVLRPLTPVNLTQHQHVYLTIAPFLNEPSTEDWLDHDCHRLAQESIGSASIEDVRQRLSKIPGSLSDDIREDRSDR